jgi:proton-translocating NADH-quinone oxidoreductase chain M
MFEFIYLYILLSLIFSIILFIFIDDLHVKLVSFIFSIFLFILSIFILIKIDFSSIFFYSYTFKFSLFYKIYLTLGIDQLSVFFLLLTTFLFPLIILASWNSIKFKLNFFYTNLLLLEFFLINVFISFDLLFFYFWFESTLIPMFLIIVIWGNQSRKINAGLYLLVYTLLFTALFFFLIIYIQFEFGTTNFFVLLNFLIINKNYQIFFWICFFLAFAVKLPLFPFHLWLPEAHVEAPTVGSIILAGLLLKLGYYGYVRFFLQILSDTFEIFNSIVIVLCMLGCIYGALLALSQIDIKKMIAYSSVSHMSLCLLGIISSNIYGLLGSFLLAIGHGFVSSALFFLVGLLYDRYHTRILDYYSGLNLVLPVFSFFFFTFLISNFGFPISINFIAEFLILLGIGYLNLIILCFLIFYSVISVAYNLWLYVRVCHGSLSKNLILNFYFYDISKIELLIILPLFFCNIFFCFMPNTLINYLIPFFISIV